MASSPGAPAPVGGASKPNTSSIGAHMWQLPRQHFTGNPLDRAYDARRKFDGTSKQGEVSLVVVAGREVCVREAPDTGGSAGSGILVPQFDLQALLMGSTDPELDLNSDSICLNWMNGACAGGAERPAGGRPYKAWAVDGGLWGS